ncbi:MAG: TAT-variant-translocated molybdopterin oxidoreductase, partial [Phycisphaeraceae bacterium]|nr:TAT-variant-translocated molybdopterin oxidoreductase [Phycisphaeraceae bacterium]
MGQQSLTEHLRGRTYWRSLEQLADSPELAAGIEREFPGYEPGDLLSMSRRGFMKIMAASMALAGLTLSGCRRWPQSQVHPFAYRPEGTLPGVPNYYATMLELGGVATGLLAKSYDGRPIKIEGNTLHPYSLGAADAYAQASVLSLYDPDRSRTPLEKQQGKNLQRDWDTFLRYVQDHFGALKASGGRGVAVLTRAASGPTFARLREAFLKTFPAATWHVWEPINLDNTIAGANLAFGQPLRTHYDLTKAQVIACFDADPLGTHPAHQRYARDWATLRRSADQGTMSRLYAAESNLSITGGVADHRLAVRPSRVTALLAAVAAEVGLADIPVELSPQEKAFVASLANDLKSHPGASAVIVGPAQPPELHALAHALNQKLGNNTKTIHYTPEPLALDGGCAGSIKALADAIASGAGGVSTLVILGGNPAYDAPADLAFPDLLAKVEHTIHLSEYYNETSLLCRWHLPEAHYLEAWGDGRAWDGTVSTQQPLILPLFGGKSALELLAILAGNPTAAGYDLVRETLTANAQGDFESAWRQLLEMGVLPTSTLPAVEVGRTRPTPLPAAIKTTPDQLEAVFTADASMYDGRFANNGWLQEMPDPMSKLTWDNAALIAKADADRLGLPTSGGMVRIEIAGRSLEMATFILPGVAPGTVVLPLGYGRTAAGNVGDNVGFNTYALRTLAALDFAPAKLTKIDGSYLLAATQEHHLIDEVGAWGRDERIGQPNKSGSIIHEATLAEYQADKHLFHRDGHGNIKLQLWEPPSSFNDPHAWGMAVDMTACIGCNACAVACQAENNVPVVGKEQVSKNREMHWLRVDRYFKGAPDDPSP